MQGNCAKASDFRYVMKAIATIRRNKLGLVAGQWCVI